MKEYLREGRTRSRAGTIVDRPLTFMYPCGGLMMDPRKESLPAAYYDHERKLIYVEPRHRKLVQKLLNAQIKSGIWTFLIGDEKQEAEEDEEVIPYYDPITGPKVGDTQVFVGDWRCIDVTYSYECIRLVGGGGPPEWIKREPLTIGRCQRRQGGPCYEVWGIVGQANIYSDAACTRLVRVADLYGWSCLEV